MNPKQQKQTLRQHGQRLHNLATRLGNAETHKTSSGDTLSQATTASEIVEAA